VGCKDKRNEEASRGSGASSLIETTLQAFQALLWRRVYDRRWLALRKAE
jgi:hypothetical protein